MSKSPKILIIGAGISGLSAAERLFQKGHSNVQILEATDRIGGRIHTRKIGNHGWIEVGAQWIHGEDENSAYAYAKKHDLVADTKSMADMTDIAYIMDDGIPIDQSVVARVDEFVHKNLHDCRNDPEKYDGRMTVEAFLDAAFQEDLASSKSQEELMERRGLLQWYKYLQCCIEGCNSLSELSLESFGKYKECDGNPLTNFKNGYSSLVDAVARKIPQNIINLGKSVVKVFRAASPGTGSALPVRVVCGDGSEYEADHVIVTTSLGCLKWNAVEMFHPPLAAEKLKAIQNLGFGTVDKIYLEFERPFWPKDTSGYSLVWRSPPDAYRDLATSWHRAIFSFCTVPFAPNVLCGWIVGAEARHMETLDDAEVKNACLALLRRFTGKADLPPLKSILRSSWHSNPYTRGSYSYFTAGQSSNHVLSEPVNAIIGNRQCPVILFAGEATHPHYYSTVHGAMETGWREADRIISYHSQSTPRSNL